ncbi:MAG TPA: hypothetical protein VL027_03005 [Spongiibacteraceae bacterium]|nr:hypothetical protein [Spongiibacteraceae bacterium]
MSNRALLTMLAILVVGTLTVIGVLVRSDRAWELADSESREVAAEALTTAQALLAAPGESAAGH